MREQPQGKAIYGWFRDFSHKFNRCVLTTFTTNGEPMTELKAIKVSKETYAELSAIAGELQVKLKRPVSIEEAMKHLINKRKKGTKISDLAGSWDVSDEELNEIKVSISQAWEKWKPQKP